MEPSPQTPEALGEVARHGQASPEVELDPMAERVRTVVPELVGLSLGVVEGGVALTLVASAEQVAALDAAQYLDGGPCVASVDRAERVDVTLADLLEGDRWQLYARAGAAIGVASSLSLPVMDGDAVIGGVNLYASTADAFAGRHDAVAGAVGTDARLAVADADLSFQARRRAGQAPDRVREGGDVNVALGIISTSQNVNIPVARQRLRDAAARAGITEAQAARAIKPVRSP